MRFDEWIEVWWWYKVVVLTSKEVFMFSLGRCLLKQGYSIKEISKHKWRSKRHRDTQLMRWQRGPWGPGLCLSFRLLFPGMFLVDFLLELKMVVYRSLSLLFVVYYTTHNISQTVGKVVPKVKQIFEGFMILRKICKSRLQGNLKI